ncbi:hypothetical protein EVG20_g11110 [Dentipellis fragilis]|uniref:F-box domain-containing protein n=1 Tax=Dentipellis fragilis TaxID=205917 RepID=A0A4Y9XMA9_9AGAM|nr:hypothetical protein EVG20_g11110 [Dentipellis fragilis]
MSDAIIDAIHRELPEFESLLATDASISRKMRQLEALLETSIHAMRVVMNSYRLINTIPFEVLAHIFSFVARGTDILPVAAVCRHWREVTLVTPSLWAALKTSDSPRILPLLVDRAKSAPFRIRLGRMWFPGPSSEMLYFCAASVGGSNPSNIWRRMRQEAPMLEHLIIESFCWEYYQGFPTLRSRKSTSARNALERPPASTGWLHK